MSSGTGRAGFNTSLSTTCHLKDTCIMGLLYYVSAKRLLRCKVLPRSHNTRQHLAVRQVRAAVGTRGSSGCAFLLHSFSGRQGGVRRCLGDPRAWSWPEIPSQPAVGEGKPRNCPLNRAEVAPRKTGFIKWDVPDLSFNKQFRNWL